MRLDEQAEQALDEFAEEMTEARREENLVYHEGCAIVTVPTIPPPEYITVTVDGVNDPNVMWRGVPATPAVGDEVLVWENPVSHRREIASASGAAGVTAKYSWCQTVVVAKCNGDFDDITDAIAYINALPAGPAANRYFALFVLGGNWVETANVTVPSYVFLIGLGEATSIEMGAFDLIMSSNSGLFDVRITLSAMGSIHVNGKTNVILEHVHGVQTSNDDVLYIYGASSGIRCKDCNFESTGNETIYVANTAAVVFDNCRMKAHAGTGYALVLADTADVTTMWCQMDALVPVFMGATTTWSHIGCQFDPDACTLTAGETPLVTGKANYDDVVTFENGATFDGISGANIVTIPTAQPIAYKLVDTAAIEYTRVDTQVAQPIYYINPAQVDVDIYLRSLALDAVFIEGATAAITLGGPSMTVLDDWWWGLGAASTRMELEGTGLNRFIFWDAHIEMTGGNIWIPDNDADAMHICDTVALAEGLEYLRFVSTDAQPVVVFNDGGADIDFRIEAIGVTSAFAVRGDIGHIGVGAAPLTSSHVYIDNSAISVTTAYYGLYMYHEKIGGVGASGFEGIRNFVTLNTVGGVIGAFRGLYTLARLDDGDVGTVASNKNMAGAETWADLNAGAVYGSVYGNKVVVDQEAANTVTGDIFGEHIQVDADGTTGGSVYMLYLDELSNVDYGIYQSGTAPHWLQGRLAVGGTVGALAQAHFDQSNNAGAIPVALFDQADLSEEFFELTTTVGAGNPIDTAATGLYYGKVRVNVTGVGYKVLALYEEA